uniref:3'-5' exonuclease domain-containing protein n=1 Tax=Strigops habroptila TaxID=2489341 RepID=A0A672U8L9_STRHB
MEGWGEIRSLSLPDVPPNQDFLSLHALKLLHLILCRVEEATKADNYEESKKKDYYQLPIPRANIHFLQTWEETLQCWEKVLQPAQVVGIDMEWRPSFGMVGKPRVSLLQIALKDEVFLLDLPRLLQQAEVDGEKEKLPNFIQMLYSDASITKLGYGMSGDLSNLAATWSALKDTDKKAQGVVDLLTVDKQLQKRSVDWKKGGQEVDVLSLEQSYEGRGIKQPEKGLSLLVQHVLGKPLDKTEQLSNWEKRPLREEQILYAASDAYCLLEIYEKLCKDPESFGLSSDLTESLVGKESIKPKAKKQLNKQEAPSPSGQQCQGSRTETQCAPAPISPKEFSVVCDNMLQGLGRYLRCLGVDVRMLENDDDHRKAAEIARQEGRVILTSGLPYQTLQSQVAEGRCFSVNSSEKAKEQALQVLKHFNVQVSLSDIFSRCQVRGCCQPQERVRFLRGHCTSPTLDMSVDVWSCRVAPGSRGELKAMDKPSWMLLCHSYSQFGSALPAPSWRAPTSAGPVGLSGHREAQGRWLGGQGSRLSSAPLLCTSSPCSCLICPSWVRIASHFAQSLMPITLARLRAQWNF